MRNTPEEIDALLYRHHMSNYVESGEDARNWWQLAILLSKLIGGYSSYQLITDEDTLYMTGRKRIKI